ncbi:hypothetical protein C8J56DRAFT_905785 [Mycena floridula]|nr:hypothetical protein C8J56DRAFT_905785 [Mycena floridula]
MWVQKDERERETKRKRHREKENQKDDQGVKEKNGNGKIQTRKKPKPLVQRIKTSRPKTTAPRPVTQNVFRSSETAKTSRPFSPETRILQGPAEIHSTRHRQRQHPPKSRAEVVRGLVFCEGGYLFFLSKFPCDDTLSFSLFPKLRQLHRLASRAAVTSCPAAPTSIATINDEVPQTKTRPSADPRNRKEKEYLLTSIWRLIALPQNARIRPQRQLPQFGVSDAEVLRRWWLGRRIALAIRQSSVSRRASSKRRNSASPFCSSSEKSDRTNKTTEGIKKRGNGEFPRNPENKIKECSSPSFPLPGFATAIIFSYCAVCCACHSWRRKFRPANDSEHSRMEARKRKTPKKTLTHQRLNKHIDALVSVLVAARGEKLWNASAFRSLSSRLSALALRLRLFPFPLSSRLPISLLSAQPRSGLPSPKELKKSLTHMQTCDPTGNRNAIKVSPYEFAILNLDEAWRFWNREQSEHYEEGAWGRAAKGDAQTERKHFDEQESPRDLLASREYPDLWKNGLNGNDGRRLNEKDDSGLSEEELKAIEEHQWPRMVAAKSGVADQNTRKFIFASNRDHNDHVIIVN